ncbi:MAG: carboxylesterase/lipase family protein [Prolixibacteraceae bacterium]
MKPIIFAAIILILTSACQPSSQEISEIVKTQNGKIEGISDSNNGLHIFKGIPFAKTPVGKLRWKAPQAVENWKGIKKCTEFSAIAMQRDPAPFSMWTSEFIAPAGNMSEDCLYLNVWTPAKSTADQLPVMVFIHGGGFNSGSGSVPIYNGVAMAKKGVIFVTINYRVGILGFFSHPELSAESPENISGNQGLLDQLAALKWVNQNIRAFGGDPNNVTISGQSAGAFSVCYLTASPLAKGLFQKAIAESGGAFRPMNQENGSNNLDAAEKRGLQLQEMLNTKSLDELKAIDAKELIKQNVPYGPIIDGHFLIKSVAETYKAGLQNDVSLISGWNEDEGLGGQVQTADQFELKIRQYFGNMAKDFLREFPSGNEEEAIASQKKLATLSSFGIQSYEWMQLQNESGKADVYLYYFTRNVPYGEGQQDFGAFHSGELAYAYNNLDQSTIRPWTEADRKLADQMSSYWVNFAKTGNPNGAGLPSWNVSNSEEDQIINFDTEIGAINIPDLSRLIVLRHFYEPQNQNIPDFPTQR